MYGKLLLVRSGGRGGGQGCLILEPAAVDVSGNASGVITLDNRMQGGGGGGGGGVASRHRLYFLTACCICGMV